MMTLPLAPQSDPEASRNALEADLLAIVDQYEQATGDDRAARRRDFLEGLQAAPSLLTNAPIAAFFAEHVESDDIDDLDWTSPDQLVLFCETLYQIQFDDKSLSERVKRQVRRLLRQALGQYEARHDLEKMFQFMRLAPSHPMMQDSELRRLRYQAYAYEMRRVRRYRRVLYTYLVIQAVLVVLVFPFLFINAENGRIQRQVEELTDVSLGDEGYQLVTYPEGLYWTIITASSIGYGDITPRTNTGRVIAIVLGTMGVITIGVVAGLIIEWISPRSLD